jgi:hypothetical protein
MLQMRNCLKTLVSLFENDCYSPLHVCYSHSLCAAYQISAAVPSGGRALCVAVLRVGAAVPASTQHAHRQAGVGFTRRSRMGAPVPAPARAFKGGSQGYLFALNSPQCLSHPCAQLVRRQNKKQVKEDRRAARQSKIPKKVKKKAIKQSSTKKKVGLLLLFTL